MEKPRVLIVEDEKDMREQIAEVIKEEYHPILAETGEKALEIIKKQSVDVILLDLRLPGISGMEVLKKLKKDDSNIEVIMVTAYPDIRNAVEATKLGAYDYIPKPFHNEDLMHTIRRAYTNLVNHRDIHILRTVVENTLNKISEKEARYGFTIKNARATKKNIPVGELEELWDLIMSYKEELEMVKESFKRSEELFNKYKPISYHIKVEEPQADEQ